MIRFKVSSGKIITATHIDLRSLYLFITKIENDQDMSEWSSDLQLYQIELLKRLLTTLSQDNPDLVRVLLGLKEYRITKIIPQIKEDFSLYVEIMIIVQFMSYHISAKSSWIIELLSYDKEMQ